MKNLLILVSCLLLWSCTKDADDELMLCVDKEQSAKEEENSIEEEQDEDEVSEAEDETDGETVVEEETVEEEVVEEEVIEEVVEPRPEDYDGVIPIIGSTGQSNNFVRPRAFGPYITTNTNIPVVFSITGGGLVDSPFNGVVHAYDKLDDCMKKGHELGFLWDFSQYLWDSGWREEVIAPRFGLVSTGAGGNLSSAWNPKSETSNRLTEFETAVDRLISDLKSKYPKSTPGLHTVIINQGESNAYNFQDYVTWKDDWSEFIKSIRSKYGQHIRFIIHTLNDNKMFERQCVEPINKSCETFSVIRAEQLELDHNSGSNWSLPGVYVLDTNILGGTNRTLIFTSNASHYSFQGANMLAKETFKLFQTFVTIP